MVKKSEKKKKTTDAKTYVYKSYDIKWLKSIGSEHPDYNLVAEYEKKHGKI